MRLAPLFLAISLLLAGPAHAAAVNNYNPTEGFVASGLESGARLFDLHFTALAGGGTTSLTPSIGYDMGIGHGWELGVTSQVAFSALGTAAAATRLDQASAYVHGPVYKPNDVVAFGVAGGVNAPFHAGADLQLGAVGIVQAAAGPVVVAFNSGYQRDVTTASGLLYENLNAGGTFGAFQPYVEAGADLYPGQTPAYDAVVRADLGYSVTDHLVADANLALFYPSLAVGPSVGVMVLF